jgi:molybdate transport system ATP-binding protein
MNLEVDVYRRLGAFTLEASFSAGGGLTAIFGPSGSGKTSLINTISGLLRPDRGRVAVDGRVLVDTAQGIFVPKHRRRVGYIFQEPRLFPHLTVRQNLLYGQWFTPSSARRERLDHIVELLGIGELLDRGPARLSGGEKQRVAIGRALLASPHVLLMDEPLAALAATGTVSEIMGRLDLVPMASRYEAGAVLEMRVASHDDTYDLTTLHSKAGELRIPRIDAAVGTSLRIRIRARDVMLALKPPEAVSALNLLSGRIAEVGALNGPIADVRVELNGEVLLARVTRFTIDHLGLVTGRPVYAIIKTVAIDRRNLGQLRSMPDESDDEITL